MNTRDTMTVNERIDLLEDAREDLRAAVEKIGEAVRGTQQQGHTNAYMIDHLEIMISEDHGFLSNSLNIDRIIEYLREEENEEDEE